MAVKALKTTLDSDFTNPKFRNLPVSLEFPVKVQSVPAVWVDLDPIGPLRPVGVGHVEDAAATAPGGGPGFLRTTRWSFAANIVYTIVTMSSLERDLLFDEIVGIMAFGQFDAQRGEFRNTIENDPLISMQVNFGTIDQRGFSASPGTPWGTTDMMYECSISMQCQGEFVNAPGTTVLIPISAVTVIPWVEGLETDPTTDGGWIG